MNSDLFLNKFSRAIDLDPATKIGMENILTELPYWDSLVVISLVAMLDLEFDVLTTANKVMQCKTVGEVYQMVQNRSQ
jgi:acyl carrier protein